MYTQKMWNFLKLWKLKYPTEQSSTKENAREGSFRINTQFLVDLLNYNIYRRKKMPLLTCRLLIENLELVFYLFIRSILLLCVFLLPLFFLLLFFSLHPSSTLLLPRTLLLRCLSNFTISIILCLLELVLNT